MPDVLGIIGIGLILGVRHAIDADHVVAVSAIVSRGHSVWNATLIGMLWGIGHTVTIGLVGSTIIGFNLAVPARVGLAMELAVGVMLVWLGFLNLSGVLERATRRMAAAGGRESRSQESPRDGAVGWFHAALKRLGTYHTLRPLTVGIIHGLAGSAAVALLVLTTIQNPYWACAYLLVFGAGTVAGMMVVTTVVAYPVACTATRFQRLSRGLVVASGFLSLGFGLLISYEVGIGRGLFTGHPVWTVR